MRLKSIILLLIGGIGLCIATPSLLRFARDRARAARINVDFIEFKQSDERTIYTWYPELLDRVLDDRDVAARVTEVVLCGPTFGIQDYSMLGRFPNLKRITVMYGTGVDSFIRRLNRITNVESVTLIYCGLTEDEMDDITSETLLSFASHGFARSISEAAVE